MASTSLFRAIRPFRSLTRARGGRQTATLDLKAIPPSLRSPDTGFDAEWRDGGFALAGHSVPVGTGSPFALTQVPASWLKALHGFAWLRHVPPHSEADTRARLEAAIWDWLRHAKGHAVVARQDGIAARRILSWLAHADLLLQTSDAKFYDAVLGALQAQVGDLERRYASIAGAGDRWLAFIALAQAGLCIEKAEGLRSSAEKAIAEELSRSSSSLRALVRKPDEAAELLLDIEALRILYGMVGQPVPPAIVRARDTFCDALRGLMLDGDRVARLGSARTSTERRSTWASVLRHVAMAASPSCHNLQAGFVRLVLGDALLVVDVGAPGESVDALAMEMSSGSAPMLVHDGLANERETAARGTLVFLQAWAGDEEQRRYPPTLEPTHSVEVDLDAAVPSLDATHAGLALRGFAHRRRVTLSQTGRRLEGIDELRPLIGRVEGPATRFAVRFVLHPSVQVTMTASPDQLELVLSNGHRWRLVTPERTISVEGAVYRDGPLTVPTLQLLVPSAIDGNRSVVWQWHRLDASATA